ncbi:MAG: amidohydrolase family protein [Pseudomonadota bacterium]|nr:amidohydrolase family protein [Pseudomonadota bacterium]
MNKIKFSLNLYLFIIVLFFSSAPMSLSQPLGYGGLIFDSMAQIDERTNFADVIKKVRKAGVSKLALFARSRKYLGQNEEEVLELRNTHKNLIILGVPKYFLLRDDLDDDYISTTLENIDKYNYLFIGEILYTHADKSHGEQTERGERYIDPLQPGTKRFLSELSGLKIPVMTHWEVYEWERDWPRFSKIYTEYRDIKFIIPHMAFGHPYQVETILSAHPNVYMTISKKEKDQRSYSDRMKASKLGLGFLDSSKILRNSWALILEKYQNRLLFATDAHKWPRWKKYRKIIRKYRKILGQLPRKTAEKIAYKNAEILYGVSVE